jgi:palmitoyl transferase
VLACVALIAAATPCLRGETRAHTPPPPAATAWYQRCCSDIKSAWSSTQWDIYAPFYEWHNRSAYGTDVRTYNYNEYAWGIGIGKSYINARGNRYSLFAAGFLDSFRKIEPQAGLMWQKIWRDKPDAWRVTLGAAAGLTARSDLKNYTPLPFVLPLLGIEYRRLSLECAYVPPLTSLNINQRGNILIAWARLRL